jgi:hypothetical protein
MVAGLDLRLESVLKMRDLREPSLGDADDKNEEAS